LVFFKWIRELKNVTPFLKNPTSNIFTNLRSITYERGSIIDTFSMNVSMAVMNKKFSRRTNRGRNIRTDGFWRLWACKDFSSRSRANKAKMTRMMCENRKLFTCSFFLFEGIGIWGLCVNRSRVYEVSGEFTGVFLLQKNFDTNLIFLFYLV
jgi:hypothetical protein